MAGNSGRRDEGMSGGGGMKEREADRRRGCGGRDGGGQDVSGDGVLGDGRDRKGEGGGVARVKAEARFTSPRIPASFYRPRDD